MDSSHDYTACLTPMKFSKDVVFKQSGKNLTIIFLDDSDSYFNLESYPAEIWLALYEGNSPSSVFNTIKTRDDLPENQFRIDFNKFISFLREEKLIFD